jgi:hypothetical protein
LGFVTNPSNFDRYQKGVTCQLSRSLVCDFLSLLRTQHSTEGPNNGEHPTLAGDVAYITLLRRNQDAEMAGAPPSAASQILLDRTGLGNPEKCRRRKELSQLDFLTHSSGPQSFRSGPPRRLEDLPAGCVRPFPTVGNLNIPLDFQDWGLWTGLRRATLLHAYPF